MLERVYEAYGITSSVNEAVAFGSGLINHTWKVNHGGSDYILQRINDNVFKQPRAIAHNINLAAEYFAKHHPMYFFVTPVKTRRQEDIFHDEDHGYFRLSPFVPDSHTIDVVSRPEQAYEASRQFGRFTSLLRGIDQQKLQITLPDFHNLDLRYTQFEEAVKNGNPSRIKQSDKLIKIARANYHLVTVFNKIREADSFFLRATHHDTKISNVLFDKNDKGLCVIDLDTLMSGYFISDLGDMMRTYLSAVSEEEKDFALIGVRPEYLEAVKEGYLEEMSDVLSNDERDHLMYAGQFMVYMQALRFLTDHMNDDAYYGAKYEGHNFVRAGNQMKLLEEISPDRRA